MSSARKLLAGALAIALAAFVHAADAQQPQSAQKAAKSPAKAPAKPPPPGVVIEPRAIELLKASSARLAGAKSMAFTATVTYEYPSLLGPPIAYTTRSAVALQRPDKLLVVTPGDGPASELYYDGKTVMAYSPAENLVAVANAPPTIEATLKLLYDAAATYYPFTDLIVNDPYAAIAEGLKSTFYVGKSSVVGGTTTEMVAVASGDVFMQIWIGAEDKLPRRVRATYARDPHQLRHQLDLADWQLDVAHPQDKFASEKAAAAHRIAFGAPVFKGPPPGVKALAKPKAVAPPQTAKSQ